MNSNSRYCMKCGNLNYDHSANANMKNYIKNDNSSYQVGSGRLIVGNVTKKKVLKLLAPKS